MNSKEVGRQLDNHTSKNINTHINWFIDFFFFF